MRIAAAYIIFCLTVRAAKVKSPPVAEVSS
jgi:hypothetical protein